MYIKLAKFSLYAIVITLAVISTVAVYAAFIAPSDTPATSIQDWIGNALGANNANNAYDSTNVTGNHDGSVLERAEDLRKTLADEGYDSSFATADVNGSVLQRLEDLEQKVSTLSAGVDSAYSACYTIRWCRDYQSDPGCVSGFTEVVSNYTPNDTNCTSGRDWSRINICCLPR